MCASDGFVWSYLQKGIISLTKKNKTVSKKGQTIQINIFGVLPKTSSDSMVKVLAIV